MEKHESRLFGYTNRIGSHWFASDEYSHNEIENISDPEGGQAQSLPSAIPSPFARIDLVKTAFRNIASTRELRRATVNNKVIAGAEEDRLVSLTLDLAQLLFMSDTLATGSGSEVEIVVWDKERDILDLERSTPAHQRYAATMRLFLNQDEAAYNFDLLDRFYIIKYRHEVIGATSPSTLFFCTANDLNHISIALTSNHRLFSSECTPLYERDRRFQLYLYQLFAHNPDLRRKMRELQQYLQKNEEILKQLKPDLYEEVKAVQGGQRLEALIPLTTSSRNEFVSVAGVQLYKLSRNEVMSSAAESDFVIQSTYVPFDRAPLVLQNSFNKPLRYVEGVWQSSYKVPSADSTPIQNRSLPERSVTYPYLTVSDFLEPYLIRLPYKIDGSKYYTGSIDSSSGAGNGRYLLPLTSMFFQFYAPHDLARNVGEAGKPALEIHESEGKVEVRLHVPIRKSGEFVVLERTYVIPESTGTATPDVIENRGIVADHTFGLTIFPFIKQSKDIGSDYRIQTIDADRHGTASGSRLKLRVFARQDEESSDTICIQRRKKALGTGGDVGTDYYVIKDDIQYIQVYDESVDKKRGVIIPLWGDRAYTPGSSKTYRFAIDVGTTNTHIEYTEGNGQPQSFETSIADQLIAPLFYSEKAGQELKGWSLELYQMILDEFVPFKFGPATEFKFPRRTVIAEKRDLVSNVEHYGLGDYNIPFTYEIRALPGMVFNTNLKWGARGQRSDSMEERLDRYIEMLMMLMRAKVLMNGGELSRTEITWFYPSSMSTGRRNDLSRAWERHFTNHFKPVSPTLLRHMPESIAPYYFYRGMARIQAAGSSPVVNIDIGGGTTDVVVFTKDRPLLESSFKFAANVLFGDGYARYGGGENSAFISRFSSHYRKLFEANKLEELLDILEEILKSGRAQDIHAFFFSVSRHKDVKDTTRFAYDNELAKDESLKIVFLYFYSAIVYHVASLLRQENAGLPRYVTFSGTGSKVLGIITSNVKTLEAFTKTIIEDVMGSQYGPDGIELIADSKHPKEATCKGGLIAEQHQSSSGKTVVCYQFPSAQGQDVSYREVSENIASVVGAVTEFNKYFAKLNTRYDMQDIFNVDPAALKLFIANIDRDVHSFVEQAIQQEMTEAGAAESDRVVETPFFYGIKGTIFRMSNQLSSLSDIS